MSRQPKYQRRSIPRPELDPPAPAASAPMRPVSGTIDKSWEAPVQSETKPSRSKSSAKPKQQGEGWDREGVAPWAAQGMQGQREMDPYAPQYTAFQDVPAGHNEVLAKERRFGLMFTPLAVLACIALMIWEFSVNDWQIEPMSVNPSAGVSVETLIECGAKDYALMISGESWRVVSAMWLHAGIIHLVFNMIALISVGAVLERTYGAIPMCIIYFASGIFSTAVSAIFLPNQIMVGASGAIFGLLGALWADLIQNWSIRERRCFSLTLLFAITAVNLILGLMPYLDNFAHISGLVMGFFLSLLLLVAPAVDAAGKDVPISWKQRLLQLFGLVTTAVLMVVVMLVLFNTDLPQDVDEWCPWCNNLSCVEVGGWWSCDECSQSGFSATTDTKTGSVTLTCPDDSSVLVASGCNTSSQNGLVQCCIDNCLG